MKKILCDCGHQEYPNEAKTINGRQICNNCWKSYLEACGQVEKGCIFWEVAVCPDREPGVIDIANKHVQEIMNGAKCYFGHQKCRHKMKKDKAILDIPDKLIKNGRARCPVKGCGHYLSLIKMEQVVVSVCPQHGVVARLLVEPQE